jgi:hypothetical protein
MKNFRHTITLICLAPLVLFCTWSIACFFFLNNHSVFENFDVNIVTPVDLSTQDSIKAIGKFDRHISCQFEEFMLVMQHAETGAKVIVDQTNLKVAPKQNVVGMNIPISFEVFVPKLASGKWSSVYVAEYFCGYMMFTSRRIEKLVPNTFMVKYSKTNG